MASKRRPTSDELRERGAVHHTERTRQTFWENAELDIASEETDLDCGLTSVNGCEDFVVLRRSMSCVPIFAELTLGRSMGTDREAADQLIPVSEFIIASIEASAIPTLPCAAGLKMTRGQPSLSRLRRSRLSTAGRSER